MLGELLIKRKMSLKELADRSGIPYATLCDLKNERKSIDDCSVRILHRLSEALDMEMGKLYKNLASYNMKDFQLYRRDLLLEVTDRGAKEILIECIAGNRIETLAKKNRLYAYYLTAMIDYLSDLNGIPRDQRFESIRKLDFGDKVPGGVERYLEWKQDSEMEEGT